ncbi:SDR family oxidoreductase [Streptomyces sp. WM6378]|uniref:SDR family oxidoreductase n=1 Tax=Streptomyces sp. WM6378 TaxID=1415557 RepID=UPI00099C6020|nr:SDR family oxidoreductase [Streptomyces sp. WM6378]
MQPARRPCRGPGVYAATKAAIRSLARTWAAGLAGRGIRVNALTPGPVTTPGADKLRATIRQRDQATESAAPTPLSRTGHADEVVNSLVWSAWGVPLWEHRGLRCRASG